MVDVFAERAVGGMRPLYAEDSPRVSRGDLEGLYRGGQTVAGRLDFAVPAGYPSAMRSSSPLMFVAIAALAPLVWVACAEPPPGNAPVAPSADTKPVASSPSSTEACEALRVEVRDALGKAHEKPGACTTEADCEILSDGICMIPSCGVSIAKAARATYEADRKRIAEPACETWTKRGCDKLVPIPIPSCPMLVPICKDGVCGSRY